MNSITYIFQYIEGIDKKIASKTLAQNFCAEKGLQLLRPYIEEVRAAMRNTVEAGKELSIEQQKNLQDEENQIFREGCLEPINEALLEKIEQVSV